MRRNNAGHNNNINISQATSLTSARTGAHIILGGVEYIDWMLCYTTPYSSMMFRFVGKSLMFPPQCNIYILSKVLE